MKILLAIGIAAAYIIGNYIVRGYLNIPSDALVIILVSAAYFALKDEWDKQEDDVPVFVKMMRSVGSIRKM